MASRLFGVAPLGVFFDASATTAPGTERPFHELGFCWNFGDPASGSFEVNGASRNEARGPVAAHVFEKPGTYEVKLQVRGARSGVGVDRVTIVVEDPERVFAGANTTCISSVGKFDGCPNGAGRVTASDVSDLSGRLSGSKRVLLRRGDAFGVERTVRINVPGPGTIGAFGSGTRPKVHPKDIERGPIFELSSGTAPLFSDFRFVDLDFDDPGRAGPNAIGSVGRASNLTLLRVRMAGMLSGIAAGPEVLDYWINRGHSGHDILDGLFVQDSEFHMITQYAFYAAARRMALLGSRVDDPRPDSRGSLLRLVWLDRAVIQSNALGPGAVEDGHVLYMPGPAYTREEGKGKKLGNGQYSERFVISDNVLTAGDRLNWTAYIGPQNMGSDERFQDILVERNVFRGGGEPLRAALALRGSVERITVRDNLFLHQRGHCVALTSWKHSSRESPDLFPSHVELVHNTCVTSHGSLLRFGDEPPPGAGGGILAFNNLVLGAETSVSSGGTLASDKNNLVFEASARAGFVGSAFARSEDLRPLGKSPLVQGGDPSIWSAWDASGRPRSPGGRPDVGALESSATSE